MRRGELSITFAHLAQWFRADPHELVSPAALRKLGADVYELLHVGADIAARAETLDKCRLAIFTPPVTL